MYCIAFCPSPYFDILQMFASHKDCNSLSLNLGPAHHATSYTLLLIVSCGHGKHSVVYMDTEELQPI